MQAPIVWFEVVGTDAEALQAYYQQLFGWQFTDMPGPAPYGAVNVAEGQVPGGVGAAPFGEGWSCFYVGVPDLDAAIARGVELGGQVLQPRTDLPDISIAVLADPEGHPYGLAMNTATS